MREPRERNGKENPAEGGVDRDCEEVGGLLFFYPTDQLGEEERRQVEGHLAGCSRCTDLLRFASRLEGALREQSGAHPDAESLSLYAENRESLSSTERALVEQHLTLCSECAEIVATIETILADGARAAAQVKPAAPMRKPAASPPSDGRQMNKPLSP